MQLVGFSVRNFRSILSTPKIRFSQSMVLIGPNNEGKSNILKALVTALELFGRYEVIRAQDGKERFLVRSGKAHYKWERDYPMSLQSNLKGESVFTLEFKLSEEEVSLFKAEIGSYLNGTLPISIIIGRDGVPRLRVIKRGRGGNVLSKKTQKIGIFVKQRLQFEYIPAIRTADSAIKVIEDIVESELEKLEINPEYKEALEKIASLQTPVLEEIGASITKTLKEFLPNVKSMNINMSTSRRYHAFRRSSEVIVDDGNPTLLERKGDGVQSLAALSLLKYSSQKNADGKQLILAIEEPESHLHPNAIHRLKKVIEEIGSKHQIIISTHCPLFVERSDLKKNIIITNNKAKLADSLKEIREVLGVRSSDNLINARLVLIVEGEDDKYSLTEIFKAKSPELKEYLNQGDLVLDSLGGASNLGYKITLYKNSICETHVFLDRDPDGVSAFETAKGSNLILDKDVHFTTCMGMKESEFEDLIDVSVYIGKMKEVFGVDLNHAKFKNNKSKWSERVRECFIVQGKNFDKKIKNEVKMVVSKEVIKNAGNAVHSTKYGPIESLIKALEEKLKIAS